MTPAQYALLLGATLSLLGLVISAILVSRAQHRRDRVRDRLTAVVAGSGSAGGTARQVILADATGAAHHRRGPLGHVFGFDPERSALYPVKWWVVVALTGAIAASVQVVVDDFLGSLSWPAVTGGWIFICRNYFGWIEGRRRAQLLSQLPDALAMIVRAIRVGIPVLEAIRIVSRECPAPTSAEFGRVVDEIAVGAPLDDAANELARRTGLPEYRFFATSLTLQMQTGGTLSDTLDGLADVIRKRAALKARGKALTAEARASAIILAILPFGTGLTLYIVNPPYLLLLFTTEKGNTMLGAAVVSLILGLSTIRMLIRRSLPQ